MSSVRESNQGVVTETTEFDDKRKNPKSSSSSSSFASSTNKRPMFDHRLLIVEQIY